MGGRCHDGDRPWMEHGRAGTPEYCFGNVYDLQCQHDHLGVCREARIGLNFSTT